VAATNGLSFCNSLEGFRLHGTTKSWVQNLLGAAVSFSIPCDHGASIKLAFHGLHHQVQGLSEIGYRRVSDVELRTSTEHSPNVFSRSNYWEPRFPRNSSNGRVSVLVCKLVGRYGTSAMESREGIGTQNDVSGRGELMYHRQAIEAGWELLKADKCARQNIANNFLASAKL